MVILDETLDAITDEGQRLHAELTVATVLLAEHAAEGLARRGRLTPRTWLMALVRAVERGVADALTIGAAVRDVLAELPLERPPTLVGLGLWAGLDASSAGLDALLWHQRDGAVGPALQWGMGADDGILGFVDATLEGTDRDKVLHDVVRSRRGLSGAAATALCAAIQHPELRIAALYALALRRDVQGDGAQWLVMAEAARTEVATNGTSEEWPPMLLVRLAGIAAGLDPTRARAWLEEARGQLDSADADAGKRAIEVAVASAAALGVGPWTAWVEARPLTRLAPVERARRVQHMVDVIALMPLADDRAAALATATELLRGIQAPAPAVSIAARMVMLATTIPNRGLSLEAVERRLSVIEDDADSAGHVVRASAMLREVPGAPAIVGKLCTPYLRALWLAELGPA